MTCLAVPVPRCLARAQPRPAGGHGCRLAQPAPGPRAAPLARRQSLRGGLLRPQQAADADTTADVPYEDASRGRAKELVDQVLAAIEGSDGGDNVTPAQKEQVDAWLKELGDVGDARELRPLADPLIWGNYNVAYVSAGRAQGGQPAGGRFRGGLGKLLFRTTLLAQSVLGPNVVTNKVAFRLLGCLPGAVGLRGTFVTCPDREGGEDRQDTVKVFFKPPVLSLPGNIHIRTGPPSSVVLKTTYVDERVRLGLGSRGSYFVFTRGGAADAAEMDQVGLQQCSTRGKAILFGLVALLMANGAWLLASAGLPPVIRAGGLVQILLGTALGGICYRGGIIQDDNEDRPEVESPTEQAAAGGSSAAPAPSSA